MADKPGGIQVGITPETKSNLDQQARAAITPAVAALKAAIAQAGIPSLLATNPLYKQPFGGAPPPPPRRPPPSGIPPGPIPPRSQAADARIGYTYARGRAGIERSGLPGYQSALSYASRELGVSATKIEESRHRLLRENDLNRLDRSLKQKQETVRQKTLRSVYSTASKKTSMGALGSASFQTTLADEAAQAQVSVADVIGARGAREHGTDLQSADRAQQQRESRERATERRDLRKQFLGQVRTSLFNPKKIADIADKVAWSSVLGGTDQTDLIQHGMDRNSVFRRQAQLATRSINPTPDQFLSAMGTRRGAMMATAAGGYYGGQGGFFGAMMGQGGGGIGGAIGALGGGGIGANMAGAVLAGAGSMGVTAIAAIAAATVAKAIQGGHQALANEEGLIQFGRVTPGTEGVRGRAQPTLTDVAMGRRGSTIPNRSDWYRAQYRETFNQATDYGLTPQEAQRLGSQVLGAAGGFPNDQANITAVQQAIQFSPLGMTKEIATRNARSGRLFGHGGNQGDFIRAAYKGGLGGDLETLSQLQAYALESNAQGISTNPQGLYNTQNAFSNVLNPVVAANTTESISRSLQKYGMGDLSGNMFQNYRDLKYFGGLKSDVAGGGFSNSNIFSSMITAGKGENTFEGVNALGKDIMGYTKDKGTAEMMMMGALQGKGVSAETIRKFINTGELSKETFRESPDLTEAGTKKYAAATISEQQTERLENTSKLLEVGNSLVNLMTRLDTTLTSLSQVIPYITPNPNMGH